MGYKVAGKSEKRKFVEISNNIAQGVYHGGTDPVETA